MTWTRIFEIVFVGAALVWIGMPLIAKAVIAWSDPSEWNG